MEHSSSKKLSLPQLFKTFPSLIIIIIIIIIKIIIIQGVS